MRSEVLLIFHWLGTRKISSQERLLEKLIYFWKNFVAQSSWIFSQSKDNIATGNFTFSLQNDASNKGNNFGD